MKGKPAVIRFIRWMALTLCMMFAALPAFAGAPDDQAIPYWEADSPAMASIVEFVAAATGQGDKAGRGYTYASDDQVVLEGNLTTKNQKTNKVFSIIDEIGKSPALVFGNSSGDLAMAEYCLQHGGRAYMLLCDDTERDYGDPNEAAAFAEDCTERGIMTVSMRDEFTTIYQSGAVMTRALDDAA